MFRARSLRRTHSMRTSLRSRRLRRRCAWQGAEMSDSLWKKEISFKRKPKPDANPDFVLPEAKPEKQSLLKKEISFSRKPKEPKEPKEPKAAKQSIWKKE